MQVPPLLLTPLDGASVDTDASCVRLPSLLIWKFVTVALLNAMHARRLSGPLSAHALGAGEMPMGVGMESERRDDAVVELAAFRRTRESPVAVGTYAYTLPDGAVKIANALDPDWPTGTTLADVMALGATPYARAETTASSTRSDPVYVRETVAAGEATVVAESEVAPVVSESKSAMGVV